MPRSSKGKDDGGNSTDGHPNEEPNEETDKEHAEKPPVVLKATDRVQCGHCNEAILAPSTIVKHFNLCRARKLELGMSEADAKKNIETKINKRKESVQKYNKSDKSRELHKRRQIEEKSNAENPFNVDALYQDEEPPYLQFEEDYHPFSMDVDQKMTPQDKHDLSETLISWAEVTDVMNADNVSKRDMNRLRKKIYPDKIDKRWKDWGNTATKRMNGIKDGIFAQEGTNIRLVDSEVKV